MKFGILGVGSIGRRHTRALLKMGHQVIAYDPEPRRDDDMAALRINGVQFVQGPHLLVEQNIDGILICSPTRYHTGDIIKIPPREMPIFVEKPIFNLDSMLSPAELEGRHIFVGYNLRFHPLVTQARAWLDEIRGPIWASFSVGQENTKYSDSILVNWSHEIDLCIHLLGPCGVYTSHVLPGQAEIVLEHTHHECISTIHLDYLSRPWYRRSIIQGTDGRIEIDFMQGRIELHDMAETRVFDSGSHDEGFDQSYREEMEAFVRFVQHGGTGVGCTGLEALDVVQIAKGALDANAA